MKRQESRAACAASAAAMAIVGAACVFAPHVAAADPTAPRSAAECRALTDFTQRGLCWDALDHAGLHDEQVVKKRDFGLGASLPAVAAIKPVKERHAKQSKPPSTEVNNLTLTIAAVGDTARGRIFLTSTDGAVWEQTDGDSVLARPSPGDTFEVSKSMMGGYMCSVTRWQSVRCQRDQ